MMAAAPIGSSAMQAREPKMPEPAVPLVLNFTVNNETID